MEEFYKSREEDFAKWIERNQMLIDNNLLTPKEIFEHAYTLGALHQISKKEESN
jgi:hypothetical protein